MKKLGNLILVGACLILAGITIIISESLGVTNVKIIVPVLLALSGISSIIYSKANKAMEVTSKFQSMKGIGLLIFALVVAFLSKDLNSFLMYVTYFTLMYGLLEIIFPFSVLNSKTSAVKDQLIFSVILGALISIGAVLLLLKTVFDPSSALIIAGSLTILIGISNLIYAFKVKAIK